MQNIGGKGGYKCKECQLTLCLNCTDKVFYGGKKSVHPHDLTLKKRNSWKCDKCKKFYKGNASFYCKQCDFDMCDKCYFQS